MRQFDQFNTYFNKWGELLVGRVIFRDSDGLPCNVYDANGVSLGNKIAINTAGRLESQVFLADKDYIVEFQAKQGDTFTSIGFATNKVTTFNISSSSKTVQIASSGTMNAMKAVDPATIESINGFKFIQLLGYNEPGDKPAVIYRWNANSAAVDNGGSVIQRSGQFATGRWELVRSFESLDVRHFNIWPIQGSLTPSGSSDNRSRISVANNYATTYGMKLFFPSPSSGTVYYDIGGLTLSYPIADGHVTFVAYNGATSTTLYINTKNTIKQLGTNTTNSFMVYGDKLYSSQNVDNDKRVHLIPGEIMVFDSNYAIDTSGEEDEVGFSDVNVVSTVGQYGDTKLHFVKCTFQGQLIADSYETEVEFENCELGQNNFNTNCDFTGMTFTNCYTDISKWNDMNKYLKAIKTIIQTNIIDLGGRTITDNVSVYGDHIFRDATFSGTVTVLQGSIDATDCVFGGTVSVGNILKCKRCTFNGLFSYSGALHLDDCTMSQNATLYIKGGDVIKNSTIRAIQINMPSNGLLSSVILDNNQINGNLTFMNNYSNSMVTGLLITNNTITGSVSKQGSGTYNATQGSYLIKNNICESTPEFDNTMREVTKINDTLTLNEHTIVNGYLQVTKYTLSDMVWNFGESTNQCHYGYSAIKSKICTWNTGYSSWYDSADARTNYNQILETGSVYNIDNKTWEDIIYFKDASGNHLNTNVITNHHLNSGDGGYTRKITFSLKPIIVK